MPTRHDQGVFGFRETNETLLTFAIVGHSCCDDSIALIDALFCVIRQSIDTFDLERYSIDLHKIEI